MTASNPETKCKNCGAPIAYVAGENVLHCGYCGSTVMIAELDNIVKLEEHFIIPNTLNKDTLQKKCREWMSTGFFKAGDLDEKAAFTKIQGLYLPFWLVNIRADTHWSGMQRRTRSVGYGNRRHTETYWEPASGSFQDQLGWIVYARTGFDEYYGLDALNPGSTATSADWGGFILGASLGDEKSKGIDLATGKRQFSVDVAKDLNIINGQITQSQSADRAKAQVTNYHRKKADGKADKITDCYTTVQIGRTELIYAPMWFAEYKYKSKIYRMALEGHKGRVISGEAPVGKWDKWVIGLGLGAAVAAVSVLAGNYYNEPRIYSIAAVAGVIVAIHALMTAFND